MRQQAAQQLAIAVEQEIQRLGMPGGRFCIELTPNEASDLSPHGLEQIELLVSANPGQPLKGLAKVASGGELSRISLAIQVITAPTKPYRPRSSKARGAALVAWRSPPR